MAERTKWWIEQTMKELMKTKPLSEIRVKEICEAAEIDRSTFYYHFQDKYDLVAWIYYTVARDMDPSSSDSAAESLKRMKKDYRFYKQAYEDHSQNALRHYILEYFCKLYEEKALEALGTEELDPQIRYSIRMFVHGGVGMSREWFLADATQSAEEIAAMMFASMPANLEAIFRNA